jgi:hypothetical protein
MSENFYRPVPTEAKKLPDIKPEGAIRLYRQSSQSWCLQVRGNLHQATRGAKAPFLMACASLNADDLRELRSAAGRQLEEEGERVVDVPGPLAVPTVHSNGTSEADLLAQLEHACETLRTAELAIQAAMPHDRDYYPQDTAPGMYHGGSARDLMSARIARVALVRTELELTHEAIVFRKTGA